MKIKQHIESILASAEMFTDIMMQSDAPIMLKTPRGWMPASVSDVPTYEELQSFLQSLDENWEAEIVKGEINRPYVMGTSRLRVNAYLASAGERLMLSIRRIPETTPSLQESGLPASLRVILDNPSGLFLISGPTGSGKTTTMAAMVDAINAMKNAHVVTIEEPIEYVFERKKAIFSQREVGVDCDSFRDGVKAAMRQRPDVIVIGEIRDRETAEQAFIAGESGHLVIGTLHASSAVGTVGKILSFFNDNERAARLQSLSGSLLAIINQTLIPKKAGDGYALAVDFIANHKREYSKLLGEPDAMQNKLDRGDDGLSISLGNSAMKLIQDNIVGKADAVKAVAANAHAYERVRA
ncbi:MAG: ATPase, T2SS/T4P/T4SS family [Hydrogenophaga sp.]|nr:ATPase, T2SS/T4P/T4SS family [Hydrogenophaga sp.]